MIPSAQGQCKEGTFTHINHCNKAMQIGLENDSEFEDEVKGDPFKIMMAIKPKMCNPLKVKCPFVIIFEKWERLLSTKTRRRRGIN